METHHPVTEDEVRSWSLCCHGKRKQLEHKDEDSLQTGKWEEKHIIIFVSLLASISWFRSCNIWHKFFCYIPAFPGTPISVVRWSIISIYYSCILLLLTITIKWTYACKIYCNKITFAPWLCFHHMITLPMDTSDIYSFIFDLDLRNEREKSFLIRHFCFKIRTRKKYFSNTSQHNMKWESFPKSWKQSLFRSFWLCLFSRSCILSQSRLVFQEWMKMWVLS